MEDKESFFVQARSAIVHPWNLNFVQKGDFIVV